MTQQLLKRCGTSIADYFLRIYNAPKDSRCLRLNNDTGLLKIIACLTMLVDHLGARVFTSCYRLQFTGAWANVFYSYDILRIIGRLAMPIFCYCVAVGCAYSRNVWKYALRMILFAILVQPLYMTAMGHSTMQTFDWANNFYRVDLIYKFFYAKKLGILFTLSFSVLILAAFRSKSYFFTFVFCLLAWLLRDKYDYGINAVVLIVLFYAFLDKPLASFLFVFAFMFNWGYNRFFSTLKLEQIFTTWKLRPSIQMYAMLPLALIYIPMKRRVRLPKWAFYAFYPAHLAAIYIIKLVEAL